MREVDLIDFTTYRISTGELLQMMEAGDIHTVDLQCSDDVDYVFGHHDREKFKVVKGEVVPRENPTTT